MYLFKVLRNKYDRLDWVSDSEKVRFEGIMRIYM